MAPSRAIAFLFPLLSGCVLITAADEREKIVEVEDTGDDIGSEKWQELAAGGYHTCGMRQNGKVECWGKDDDHQSDPPAEGVFKSITAGSKHTCGLQQAPNDNIPLCWGDHDQGAVDAPQVPFQKIAAGGFHNCGIQIDGTALCWGNNDDGQSDVVPGEKYLDISAGRHHTCAVKEDHTLVCWGENDCGQTSYPGESKWDRVYAGEQYSCALDNTGEITCWGSAEEEGCDYTDNTLEVPATDPKDFDEPWVWADMAAGPFHGCGLTTLHKVYCWGQAGQGATDVDDDPDYVQVVAGGDSGGDHTCALTTTNEILCTGYDTFGQCTPPVDPDDTDTKDDTGTKPKK